MVTFPNLKLDNSSDTLTATEEGLGDGEAGLLNVPFEFLSVKK